MPARDGLKLPSYLTLPPGSDPDGDGVPDKAVPLVLLVHGGPWARDGYGFNRAHQWLANRGYAVLSVNFRGSTGFGKGFINAGNLEWGAKMHDDLIDAVEWAVEQGHHRERDQVAIMGGSYGGYATLAGPDLHARRVRVRGRHRRPVEPRDAARDDPALLGAASEAVPRAHGQPRTRPKASHCSSERSPLYKASEINKPLLIGQGANDPRVKQAESDQIVARDAGRQRSGNLRAVPRRRPRLRQARQQHRVQRRGRELPRHLPRRPRRADRRHAGGVDGARS